MFVPTIKYRRVNDVHDIEQSVKKLDLNDTATLPTTSNASISAKQEEKEAPETTVVPATAPSPSNTEEPEKPQQNQTAQEEKEALEHPKKEDEEKMKKNETDKGTSNNTADAEPTIQVDPSDEDRIVVTLSNGKKYTADRYCPHAGADLSYLGEVAEDEYPPEIGPVLLCTIHYWEFALEKGGRSGGGWATLNACPAGECPAKDAKLEW